MSKEGFLEKGIGLLASNKSSELRSGSRSLRAFLLIRLIAERLVFLGMLPKPETIAPRPLGPDALDLRLVGGPGFGGTGLEGKSLVGPSFETSGLAVPSLWGPILGPGFDGPSFVGPGFNNDDSLDLWPILDAPSRGA